MDFCGHDSTDWVVKLRDPGQQGGALEELRGILLTGLRRAFSGKGGGESFCEDIVQETLLRILDRLDQFAGRSKFTTWATSIAVRIGTSELRRKMFQDVSLSAMGSDALIIKMTSQSAVQPEDQAEKRQILKTLKRLIEERLTDRQRTATEAILGGMPVEEIAKRIDSNRNAVYKLIHDARLRLKSGLEAAGYSGDDISAAFS